jgi:hypothetical protein
MLDRFLPSVFDDYHEFAVILELKFDSGFEENIKCYKKHLAVASTMKDAEGNPERLH